MVQRIKGRVRHYTVVATQGFWDLRERSPAFDHLVRSYERYVDRRGSVLAASVTYFAFLSFFPLLALAFSVLGYVAAFDADARSYLTEGLNEFLPGIAEQLPLEEVAQARVGAGLLGLLGLLYTGLGAIAALREALHTIWLKNVTEGPNFLVSKLIDVLVVAVLGLGLLGSVALTSAAQAATDWLLGWASLEGSLAAGLTTRLLGVAIAVAVDLVIFLVVFKELSGTKRPWRLLWRGALLAAAGFEVLKAVGALLIRSTLDNPVYASFTVVVGLLVWINIVARFTMFAAAWTATWLPVPPPYQGAVPVSFPVSATSADPAHLVPRRDRTASNAAVLPARPVADVRGRGGTVGGRGRTPASGGNRARTMAAVAAGLACAGAAACIMRLCRRMPRAASDAKLTGR